jgi:hypothetical protein
MLKMRPSLSGAINPRARAAGAVLTLTVASAAGLAAACSSASDEGQAQYCETTREYFIARVWEPILARKCLACHTAQGQARASRLVLEGPLTPGFTDQNLATVADVASYTIRGISTILLKPTAQVEHGGGLQIQPGSEEYRALSELVSRLQAGTPACAPVPTAARFPAVTLQPLSGALYKASLRVAGRLPTEAEMTRVSAADERTAERAFNEVIEAMMAEPGFERAVKAMFQAEAGFLPTIPNEVDYPKILGYSGEELYAVMLSIGSEPLDLIAHVVREKRPLTEILTADYTVVSPLTAEVYGVEDQVTFKNPKDPDERAVAKLSIEGLGGRPVEVPHAGVLTTPSFLRTYTSGSRQRHRATAVFSIFAGTDITRLARDGMDLTWKSSDFNPALNKDACKLCHAELDRVAGTFLNWTPSGAYSPPASGWYPDMPPPGFGEAEVPKDELDRSHQILAERVAASPRFRWAMAKIVYRALTGRDPLPYPDPEERDAPSYAAKLKAWIAQDTFFKSATDAFAAEGYRLQTLVRYVVKSPYFRAVRADLPAGAAQDELEDLGTMRLLPPDLLDKKLVSLTGITKWSSRIADEYHYFYALGAAGTRFSVEEREEQPSGLMAAVAERMAHDTACFATAVDFTRDAGDRLLFPHVEPTSAPVTEGGADDAAAAAAIKKNIRYLHARLFGELLPEGDPEIERTYALFVDTLREGAKAIAEGDEKETLPWSCQSGSVDPTIPADRQITEDPRYVLRAWMAVLKAMLSDPLFLYEQ